MRCVVPGLREQVGQRAAMTVEVHVSCRVAARVAQVVNAQDRRPVLQRREVERGLFDGEVLAYGVQLAGDGDFEGGQVLAADVQGQPAGVQRADDAAILVAQDLDRQIGEPGQSCRKELGRLPRRLLLLAACSVPGLSIIRSAGTRSPVALPMAAHSSPTSEPEARLSGKFLVRHAKLVEDLSAALAQVSEGHVLNCHGRAPSPSVFYTTGGVGHSTDPRLEIWVRGVPVTPVMACPPQCA